MLANSFKIRSGKFLKETEKAYVFQTAKSQGGKVLSIPKSQVLHYEHVIVNNHHTQEDESWIEMSVTQWLWNKASLEKKLKHHKIASDVIIDNESHFGVDWNYVIMKRRNLKNCFFCHGKLRLANKTKDHLIPKVILKAYGHKGGIANNTVPCCFECNQEKGSLPLEVYRDYVRRMISETGGPKYRIILFTLDKILL